MQRIGTGLYLHIPFCQDKCGYCDFNTYVGLGHLYERYVATLTAEARLLAPMFGDAVDTVFLGGGTPTVLPVELLGELLTNCFSVFSVREGAEVTSEANPGVVSLEYLRALHNLGVNRLSLGAQSFDDKELDRHALLPARPLHHEIQPAGIQRRGNAAGFSRAATRQPRMTRGRGSSPACTNCRSCCAR